MDPIKETGSCHLEDVHIKDMEKQPQQIQVAPSDQAHIRRMFDHRVLPIVPDRLSMVRTYMLLHCVYGAWGAAAMCSGAVHNLAELIVCRCLLGVFEAAFGAGAPYFLSLFYQRRELGFRVSLLLGMSPVANCFASALAYGITHIRHSIASWRYLFIIEGAPTVLFSAIVFFFLPDSPGTAKFLNETERTQAVERLQTFDRTAKNRLDRSQVFRGLTDYKNWVHTFIHFCCNFSFAGLSNFLPTILHDMGYTSINAQGLAAPPYLASFILCVVAALISDRYGRRGLIIAVSAATGMIGYLILAVVQDESKTGVRYLGVWLATCGIFPALSINITWLLNNQGGDSKKGAGMAILAVLGQCSSFVSSTAFPRTEGPFYVRGCAIGCALTGCIVVFALGLYAKLVHENKVRDSYLIAEGTCGSFCRWGVEDIEWVESPYMEDIKWFESLYMEDIKYFKIFNIL
ncbi:MFS transporter, putative [Aspergillus fumigatus A1163]|uniref:MFS transporter, putative n=1 Tax=Aspergillus fumigatus (strain CBS 144.89 / FGSC A1163 / CEA10) TaxID=451804 RepID=B0XSQ1_ASPFC|nr:MFS transporter, putative [Aspergillus fumigatus A1163]